MSDNNNSIDNAAQEQEQNAAAAQEQETEEATEEAPAEKTPAEKKKEAGEKAREALLGKAVSYAKAAESGLSHNRILAGEALDSYLCRVVKDGLPRATGIKRFQTMYFLATNEDCSDELCSLILSVYHLILLTMGADFLTKLRKGKEVPAFSWVGLTAVSSAVCRTDPKDTQCVTYRFADKVDQPKMTDLLNKWIVGVNGARIQTKDLDAGYREMIGKPRQTAPAAPAANGTTNGTNGTDASANGTTNGQTNGVTVGKKPAAPSAVTPPAANNGPAPAAPAPLMATGQAFSAVNAGEALLKQLESCAAPSETAERFGFKLGLNGQLAAKAFNGLLSAASDDMLAAFAAEIVKEQAERVQIRQRKAAKASTVETGATVGNGQRISA